MPVYLASHHAHLPASHHQVNLTLPCSFSITWKPIIKPVSRCLGTQFNYKAADLLGEEKCEHRGDREIKSKLSYRRVRLALLHTLGTLSDLSLKKRKEAYLYGMANTWFCQSIYC